MIAFLRRQTRVLPVVIAISCKLYGVDGVVLINQANALAGNVTPGDTAGFPVTISQPGSYRLSGNLTVPDANTNAIEIASNNVSIDLNGFSIIGPTVCNSIGVCTNTGKGIGIVDAIPFLEQSRGVQWQRSRYG